jgi:hypothetical protein
MPSGNFEIIRAAIRNRQQIRAVYNGRPRLACPHVLGYKHGRAMALFYQFGGDSESGLEGPIRSPYGSPENWRCVFVDDLEQVEAVPGQWYSALTQGGRQTCIDQVIEEVGG